MDEFLRVAAPAPSQMPLRGSVSDAKAKEARTKGSAPSTQSEEPYGVYTASTPSGLEIYYQAGPKRLYRILQTERLRDLHPVNSPEWVEVPSVSTILGCLDKPALPWWGMKVGVEGFLKLHEQVEFRHRLAGKNFAHGNLTVEQVVDLLTEHKLTVNHVRDSAGARGTSVHDALEAWVKTRTLPSPKVYPESERGYVEGLRLFLRAIDLSDWNAQAEVMVASLEHGYAGRYDLRMTTTADIELVTKTYPKKIQKTEAFAAGTRIWDLKTSAGVYASHYMQLEAYEAASVECGYAPTDERVVIHVTADGRYEAIRSKASFQNFLAVKSAYDALEEIKGRRK